MWLSPVLQSGDDGVALLCAVVQDARGKLCLRTSLLPDLKIDGELSDRLVTYKLSFLPSFSSSSCLHTSTSIELLYQTTIDHNRVLHTRTFDKPHTINFTTTATMDSGAPQNNQNTSASGRRRVTSPVPSLNGLILMNHVRAPASCLPLQASNSKSEAPRPTRPVARVCRTKQQREASSASSSTSASSPHHNATSG